MGAKENESKRNSNESFKFSGNWEKQSLALKEKYPKLTSEDVKFENGKEMDLIKRLETKLGKNHNEIVDVLKANYTTVTKSA